MMPDVWTAFSALAPAPASVLSVSQKPKTKWNFTNCLEIMKSFASNFFEDAMELC